MRARGDAHFRRARGPAGSWRLGLRPPRANCPARNGVETWGAYETADGRPPARPAPTRSSPLLGRILRCTPDGARRRRSGGARRRPGCRGCDRRPRGGGGDRFAVGRSGGLERLTHLPHGERGVDAAPRRARAGRGASATLWPTGGRARRVLRDHAFPRRSRRASGHRRGEGGGAGRASVWRRAGQITPGGIGVHQGYVEIVAPDGPSLRVGRQELSLGDQRLVGPLDWAMQARSFDAVRLSGQAKDLAYELFGAMTRAPSDFEGGR